MELSKVRTKEERKAYFGRLKYRFKVPWYFDTWYSKIICMSGMISLVFTIMVVLNYLIN